MPYVITTMAIEPNGNLNRWIGCRAVATLEEARDLAMGEVEAHHDANVPDFHTIAAALPEAGGTVGPLPDGTVIEVEEVTVAEVARRADVTIADVHTAPGGTSIAEIIDAFNVQEGATNADA